MTVGSSDPHPTQSRRDRNWTIVQMLYRDPVPVSERHPAGWTHRREKYVVMNGLKSRAEAVVEGWLSTYPSRREHLHEVHYYPRNYAGDYRALVAAGRVLA